MNQSSSDSLLRFRSESPILEKATYLISNSLGAMPRAAARALADYAETWATRGVRAWADSWWDMSATVGDTIAPLIGAAAGTVSMLPNARDIVVDYRPGVGIRLSPHFYTDDAELDLAFSAIDEIRATGAWRRWIEQPSLAT
jgi:selenocysteine lyase/cysteine desulfurase